MSAAHFQIFLTLALYLVFAFGFHAALGRLRITGGLYRRKMVMALLGFAAWLTFFLVLSYRDLLSDFSMRPPPFIFVFLAILAASFLFSFSSWGLVFSKGLSFPELVIFQSFRILVEMMLVQAGLEGLVPIRMTLEGWNIDILTGLSALILGVYLLFFPTYHWVRVWNCFGLIALANVVTIGFLSFPAPWRVFFDDVSNIWVTQFPYILLPTCFVTLALTGHLIIFRKLALSAAR